MYAILKWAILLDGETRLTLTPFWSLQTSLLPPINTVKMLADWSVAQPAIVRQR